MSRRSLGGRLLGLPAWSAPPLPPQLLPLLLLSAAAVPPSLAGEQSAPRGEAPRPPPARARAEPAAAPCAPAEPWVRQSLLAAVSGLWGGGGGRAKERASAG